MSSLTASDTGIQMNQMSSLAASDTGIPVHVSAAKGEAQRSKQSEGSDETGTHTKSTNQTRTHKNNKGTGASSAVARLKARLDGEGGNSLAAAGATPFAPLPQSG